MISKFVGLTWVFGSLVLVFFFESKGPASGIMRIFHWPAMVLTGLGPFGLVLLCSDWKSICAAWKLGRASSPVRMRERADFDASCMQEISRKFYSGTASALKAIRLDSSTEVMKRTADRLASRIPVVDTRLMLDRERERVLGSIQQALSLVGLGLRLAPSIGMLGTILGMVQLLAHLTDPSQIGSQMSLALMTTFYGLFFSLLVWTPVQHRLESIRDAELNVYDQIDHWLEILEKRKPATYLEQTGDTRLETQSVSKEREMRA